jgi:uncharacterized phiE125 gp8 family phage protein
MLYTNRYNYDYLRHKNYKYEVIEGAEKPFIDLALIKTHLKLDSDSTDEDSYLNMIGNAAFNYAEKFTNLTFLKTKYQTFRDSFSTRAFVIRRTPMLEVDKIEYRETSEDDWQLLETDKYVVTKENYYSRIIRAKQQQWPIGVETEQQNIRITFDAGFGESFDDVPDDLKMAMLNHVAMLYEERGDCTPLAVDKALPHNAVIIYGQYKVPNITGAESDGFGINV